MTQAQPNSVHSWDLTPPETAEELLVALLAGNPVRIAGHMIHYNAADGVTWMDNPYGVEGVFCPAEPTLDVCERFLARVANGSIYGPEP